MDYGSLTDINMSQAQIDKNAAAILYSAVQAVKAILARRKELDRQGLADQPLIVIFGESHDSPEHHLHHRQVLKLLAENGEKIVFGYEEQHNLLSQTFFKEMHRPYDPVIEACLQARDSNGQLSLQSLSGFSDIKYADHARTVLLRFLQDNPDIAVRFTDAALPKGHLDTGDPSTAQSMKDCLGGAVNGIHAAFPEGLQVRNHHMAGKMMAFAQESKARIAVQHCGNNHVLGNRYRGKPANQSLSFYFKKLNLPILAMPILEFYFDERYIPKDHDCTEDEILFLKDVPTKSAIYEPFPNKIEPDTNSNNDSDNDSENDSFSSYDRVHFKSAVAEAAYVNALLVSMGEQEARLSVSEHWKERIALKTDMMEQFETWDELFLPSGLMPH